MSQQPWGNAPARRTGWPQASPSGPWGAPSGQRWSQPPAAWPPAPPPGGFPNRRPPRRRGFFGTLVRLALFVAALMVVLSVLRGFVSAAGEQSGQQPDTPGQPAVGGYVNEGYQPPPPDMNPPELPAPSTVGEARNLLRANPVYDQSVPVPTNCQMARIDPRTASRSQLQTHLNDLMGCLMTVWEPPVTSAGFQLPRPPVYVYDQPIRTACGVMKEVNAAYCAGDQRVYYAQPLLRAFPTSVQQTPYAAETIIAHEFGHAVQARTGILISDKALEQRASASEARQMSRRAETQADCLSAQYVRSVAQSQNLGEANLEQLRQLAYNIGDDVLSGNPGIDEGHGLGRSRQGWFTTGLGSSQVGVCNTWVAPASSVR